MWTNEYLVQNITSSCKHHLLRCAGLHHMQSMEKANFILWVTQYCLPRRTIQQKTQKSTGRNV